jgi:hypothetical protein
MGHASFKGLLERCRSFRNLTIRGQKRLREMGLLKITSMLEVGRG